MIQYSKNLIRKMNTAVSCKCAKYTRETSEDNVTCTPLVTADWSANECLRRVNQYSVNLQRGFTADSQLTSRSRARMEVVCEETAAAACRLIVLLGHTAAKPPCTGVSHWWGRFPQMIWESSTRRGHSWHLAFCCSSLSFSSDIAARGTKAQQRIKLISFLKNKQFMLEK